MLQVKVRVAEWALGVLVTVDRNRRGSFSQQPGGQQAGEVGDRVTWSLPDLRF